MIFVSTISVIGILFFGIIISFYFYMSHTFRYWKRNGIQCIEKPSFPLGNFWGILSCAVGMNLQFSTWHERCKGPYGGVYLFDRPTLIVKDLDVIKHILVKDFNYFCDRGMYVDEHKEPLSGHLFRLNGNRWRYMRSKLSPAFTIGKLKMMFEILEKCGQQWENSLENITENGSNINISEQCEKFSGDTIASVVFGIEVDSFKDSKNRFRKMVLTLLHNVSYIRYIIFNLVLFTPNIFEITGIESLYRKSNEQIFSIVKEVVEYREKHKVTRCDFMQMLIQLKNQGEVNIEDNVDNVDVYDKHQTNRLSIYEMSASAYSMFYAGFDTAANTIGFCLYHLAMNLEIQDRVQEDIDCNLSKYGGRITYQAIMGMTYLDKVICETLRMYPILSFIKRRAVKDYRLPSSNLVIKEGVSIIVSIRGLHHDPEHFPDPETFDPERFAPENRANIRPFAYMPFGEGPRHCIGKKLGILQSKVGVAQFLRKHSVNICKETNTEMKLNPIMLPVCPEKPIILKVSKRKISYTTSQ